MQEDVLEKLRLDRWLWACRFFKTRSQASKACNEGKVKLEGDPVKAARIVKFGDIYTIRIGNITKTIRVTGLALLRSKSAIATQNYEDLTPPEEKEKAQVHHYFLFHTGKRLSKSGRPTKKLRRDIGRYFEDDATE